MRKALFLALLFVSACTLASFIPASTHAQTIKFKVTPRVIDREVEPRDIFTENISIQNNAGHKIQVFASVNAVNIDEGGDIVDFTPPSQSDNTVTVTSWLSITRASIEMNDGETVEVPLNIKIHPQAEPGIYHAFIGFGTGRNQDEAISQIKRGIAPGVIVTIKVSQNQVEFLKLNNFVIDRLVLSPENEAVHYFLKNPGSAPVVPRGEIIISNGRGEEKASVLINPERETLKPNQEKEYSAAIPTDGLLGKYKAFLSVDYGTEQVASVYDTTFFYVLPWKQLLIVFAVVSVLLVTMTLVLHRRFTVVDNEDDDPGTDYIPLFVRSGSSEEKDHDINLKSDK